ncbi:MAG TPA: serine hydrolase domain-containing protein, partial [Vicinamibacterales bacterium]|nr:serine hydrolase domain-containing protein [Vicinamibacterales bacterium]
MALAVLAVLACAPARAQGQAISPEQRGRIDAIFSRFTLSTPGCAVGVARGGETVFEKAYGLADLEREVPNRPDTIFEAGSIAKQFTAAAVLLLAKDRKLSLDDPIRRYVPELPEHNAPVTLRHALTHTGGLRDWGEIAALG